MLETHYRGDRRHTSDCLTTVTAVT